MDDLERPNQDFKIGDKVRIKHDILREDFIGDPDIMVTPMREYAGEATTITRATRHLRIELDNGAWNWPANALELEEE